MGDPFGRPVFAHALVDFLEAFLRTGSALVRHIPTVDRKSFSAGVAM